MIKFLPFLLLFGCNSIQYVQPIIEIPERPIECDNMDYRKEIEIFAKAGNKQTNEEAKTKEKIIVELGACVVELTSWSVTVENIINRYNDVGANRKA